MANQLASYVNPYFLADRNKLLQQTSEYPEYGQLVDFLTNRRKLPTIETKVTPGVYGQFIPRSNKIELSGDLSFPAQPNTVVHELTHATQGQIGALNEELKKKEKLSPLEQQFVDNYKKLVLDFKGFYKTPIFQTTEVANKLAPDWSKKERFYRASPIELPAFGMGNVATKADVHNSAPLHVDPTMATEFGILLDMANRIEKAKQVKYTR